jgi:hypothetical protein
VALFAGSGVNSGVSFKRDAVTVGDQGSGDFIVSGGASADFGLTSRAGQLLLGTNSTTRVTLANAGNVTIAAPSGGSSLTVNGAANADTMFVKGSSTTGQSLGVLVEAGTNSSDIALRVLNQAGSVNYFQVRGDGVVFGNDGTSLFELGYKDTPINSQGVNYTLVVSDRGKTVNVGNGTTVTIPNGVFSGGATISLSLGAGFSATIAQGAGLTLNWAGNGSTSGNRTFSGTGLATVLFLTSSLAIISGAGLS